MDVSRQLQSQPLIVESAILFSILSSAPVASPDEISDLPLRGTPGLAERFCEGLTSLTLWGLQDGVLHDLVGSLGNDKKTSRIGTPLSGGANVRENFATEPAYQQTATDNFSKAVGNLRPLSYFSSFFNATMKP